MRWQAERSSCTALVAVLLLAATANTEPRWEPGRRTTSQVGDGVRAPTSDADGAYGRFEGDVDLGLGLGAELDADDARGAARLSAHYFSSIGIYAGFAQTLDDDESALLRVLSVGIDLRPAFLPRFATNREQGPPFLDLALDSISLGLGAYWADPAGGDFGDARGFELSGGLGLPLFGRANGLWLEGRYLGRFADGVSDTRPTVLLLLSWHGYVLSPLARNAP